MNKMLSISRWLPTGLFVALLVIALPSPAQDGDSQPASAQSASEAYWLVSLAWSPEFCHNAPEFREEPQCAEAHGFVLTSLEPWSDAGPIRPCGKPEAEVPRDILSWMMDTMLNRRWIRYQWRAQGGCTDLAPDEYFVQAQYLGSRVVVPAAFRQSFGVLSTDSEQVREDFVASNADLTASSVGVRCERGWLSEVRFCVNRDFSYRECAAALPANCGADVKVRGIDPRLKLADAG